MYNPLPSCFFLRALCRCCLCTVGTTAFGVLRFQFNPNRSVFAECFWCLRWERLKNDICGHNARWARGVCVGLVGVRSTIILSLVCSHEVWVPARKPIYGSGVGCIRWLLKNPLGNKLLQTRSLLCVCRLHPLCDSASYAAIIDDDWAVHHLSGLWSAAECKSVTTLFHWSVMRFTRRIWWSKRQI